MPIRLRHAKRARTDSVKTVTVTFGDENMNLDYRMGALSPRKLAALQGNTSVTMMADFLNDVLVSWEVVDDDGEMLPIDHDTLMDMPMDFLAAISGAIGEDVQVPKQNTSSFSTG